MDTNNQSLPPVLLYKLQMTENHCSSFYTRAVNATKFLESQFPNVAMMYFYKEKLEVLNQIMKKFQSQLQLTTDNPL